jgi:hypothetical protein
MNELLTNGFMSIIVGDIQKKLNFMTDKELLKLIKYCNKLDTNNCGWIDYGLREIIKELCKLKLKDKSLLNKIKNK